MKFNQKNQLKKQFLTISTSLLLMSSAQTLIGCTGDFNIPSGIGLEESNQNNEASEEKLDKSSENHSNSDSKMLSESKVKTSVAPGDKPNQAQTTGKKSGGTTIGEVATHKLSTGNVAKKVIPSPNSSPNPMTIPDGASNGNSCGAACDNLVSSVLNGKVYDEEHQEVNGATVSVKSLTDTVVFNVQMDTIAGTYSFLDAPPNTELEITVSKAGYASRKRVVNTGNISGSDPNTHTYYFGYHGSPTFGGTNENALNNKPEVIAVSASTNPSGVEPLNIYTMTFSEPMDKDSVEDTFAIRAFDSVKLTVDSTSTTDTFIGSGDISLTTGNMIWDKNAFNINWNSDDTEVTFTFKDKRTLPTDTTIVFQKKNFLKYS